METRFVLEPILSAEFDLSRQPIATCVDRGTDDRRESRIDESLPADNRENPESLRIGCAGPTYAEEVASSQTSA